MEKHRCSCAGTPGDMFTVVMCLLLSRLFGDHGNNRSSLLSEQMELT